MIPLNGLHDPLLKIAFPIHTYVYMPLCIMSDPGVKLGWGFNDLLQARRNAIA